MFDCFAAGGYTGRMEEINFGSRTTFCADTGAAGGAETGTVAGSSATGGAGAFEIRPEEVSRLAEGFPPTASVEEISVNGAASSLALDSF
jgi:hypothetical protein